MKKTCLLVIGMHRSGTSALTGVLSMLDVYLGSELMPETEANKRGYFENSTLYPINDRLLDHMDSSWDDIFFDEQKISNVQDVYALKTEIKKEFGHSNLFAIKDPRIAFLFPIYKHVLEELGINIKVIIPFRNPMEVANSLNRRNNFSYEKGILLWVRHFLFAEKFSREHERVFIGFNNLISDPEGSVTLISEKLHINLKSEYAKKRQQIDDFLEPGLKHHNQSIDSLPKNTSKVVRDIFLHQNTFNDNEISIKFDVIREEFLGYQKIFYNQEITNAFVELKIKTQNLIETEKLLEHRTENVEQTTQQLNEAELELQRKTQELEQKTQLIDETEKILFQKNQEINLIQDELIAILTTTSWRITSPLRKLKRIFQ